MDWGSPMMRVRKRLAAVRRELDETRKRLATAERLLADRPKETT